MKIIRRYVRMKFSPFNVSCFRVLLLLFSSKWWSQSLIKKKRDVHCKLRQEDGNRLTDSTSDAFSKSDLDERIDQSRVPWNSNVGWWYVYRELYYLKWVNGNPAAMGHHSVTVDTYFLNYRSYFDWSQHLTDVQTITILYCILST